MIPSAPAFAALVALVLKLQFPCWMSATALFKERSASALQSESVTGIRGIGKRKAPGAGKCSEGDVG